MSSPVYRRAAEFMDAEIGEELVAMDVAAGDCFSFNPVATSVWRSLSSPKSFDDLRDELLNEYDVGSDRCTSELKDLLDDLVAKGVLDQIG
jgi:hypothetical protein